MGASNENNYYKKIFCYQNESEGARRQKKENRSRGRALGLTFQILGSNPRNLYFLFIFVLNFNRFCFVIEISQYLIENSEIESKI